MRPPTVRKLLDDAVPIPEGVRFRQLKTHFDPRGDLTELYRASWDDCMTPKQWNVAHSRANVLRGVHVHALHEDLLVVVAGEMLLGLQDMRSGKADVGIATMVRMSFDDPFMVSIPPGVAHGFYFPQPCCHIYAVDREFDAADEMGCDWADPDLRLDWPCADPELSERDRGAMPFADLLVQLGERAKR
jgi:dTDP-4-dehydrorhamnose 3,5-epimerase